MNCDLAQAESCFAQLFDQLPICSAMDHTGELAFRCQHFNVLDICFGDNQIRCLPAAIGTAARTAYQKRVDGCLFANKAEQQQAEHQPQKQQQQTRSHLHGRGEPVGLLAPPSELQFISLFGYLQTQCRPRRRSPSSSASSSAGGMDSGGGERASARRAHLRASEPGGGGTSAAAAGANCSAVYTDEVLEACEEEMKKRQPQPFLQLERHRLLRLKLDASSKLLHFPETRPEDECLMVRSVLSDIFLIHQKFCFHTTVTRCLCERMHFERSCGIQCSNLEAYGLPLNRQLMWTDFRGRLSAADGRPMGGQRHFLLLLIVTMLALMLPSWMASGGGWRR